MQKRRQFSAEFKGKPGRRCDASKTVFFLEQEFLQNSAIVFIPAGNRKWKKKEETEYTAKFYEEIGRLKVEVNFLKKRI